MAVTSKIHYGQLHFKVLLLTGKVMAPRLKTVKINGNEPLLKKKTLHLMTRLF